MNCSVCNARLNEGDPICPVCGYANKTGEGANMETRAKNAPVPAKPEQNGPAAAAIDPPVPAKPDQNAPAAAVDPHGMAPRAQKAPRRRFKARYVVIIASAVLLIVLIAVYALIIKPLNAPQTRMAVAVWRFVTSFNEIKGDELMPRLASQDHLLEVELGPKLNIPFLGGADIALTGGRTGESAALELELSALDTALITIKAAQTPEDLLLASYIGAKTSCARLAAAGGGQSALTPEAKADFLKKTAQHFYNLMDERWFSEQAREVSVNGGEAVDAAVITLSMEGDDILAFFDGVRAVLRDDEEYSAMLNELIGQQNRAELDKLLSSAPDLVAGLPGARLTLEAIGADNPIGLCARFTGGDYDVGLEIMRAASGDITDYELKFSGSIPGMAQGSAQARLRFDCALDDMTVTGSYENETEGTRRYEDSVSFTLQLSLDEAREGEFTGEVSLDVAQGDRPGAEGGTSRVFGGVKIDFNANGDGLLADVDSLRAVSVKAGSAPDLIAEFLSGLRLSEIIGVLNLGY